MAGTASVTKSGVRTSSPKALEATNFKELVKAYVGQKCAVMCARWQYRGVVSAALDDCFVLSHATCVETSGASSSERPSIEDPVNGDVCVKYDAIEIFYQPNWVHADLPGLDDKKS